MLKPVVHIGANASCAQDVMLIDDNANKVWTSTSMPMPTPTMCVATHTPTSTPCTSTQRRCKAISTNPSRVRRRQRYPHALASVGTCSRRCKLREPIPAGIPVLLERLAKTASPTEAAPTKCSSRSGLRRRSRPAPNLPTDI